MDEDNIHILQCSPASVGLAQALPQDVIVSELLDYICVVGNEGGETVTMVTAAK